MLREAARPSDLTDYLNCGILISLFFGGWLAPFQNVEFLSFLEYVPGWMWFLMKTFVFLYVFLWVRATLPRVEATGSSYAPTPEPV